MKVDDYVGRPRDSQREDNLAKQLRHLDSEDAFAFIYEFTEREPVIGLQLANRCLRDRSQFEKLLLLGFERADVSSIRHWYEACLSRLGARRVFELLYDYLNDHPTARDRLLYNARIVLTQAEPGLKPSLDALADD
jgi:hypothetical protein